MKIQRLLHLTVEIFVPVIIGLGVLWFWRLSTEDQVENLRWLSSALIQAYAAILALVPTISLALLSFSAPKYPTRLIEKLWESRHMNFFFFVLTGSIAICYSILVSLSATQSFSSEIIGVSWSVPDVYIVVESSTIFCVILILYLLLEDIYEVVGGYEDGVLSDLIDDIKNRNNAEIAFEDFFYIIVSWAENKNLKSLRKGIEKCFDLVIENNEHYEIVCNIFSSIVEGYEKKNEYFCLNATKRMIDRGYARIAELDDTFLINKCLDQMTGKDSLRAFYINQIKEKRHVLDINHEKTMKIIQRIINSSENGLKELEQSEIVFLDTLFCFMVEVWKYLNSSEIPLLQKNEFMRTLSDSLKMLVKRASGTETKETDTKLCNFVDSLEKFQERLDSQEPYYHEYISFLKWLENEYSVYCKDSEENIITILYKRLVDQE